MTNWGRLEAQTRQIARHHAALIKNRDPYYYCAGCGLISNTPITESPPDGWEYIVDDVIIAGHGYWLCRSCVNE